MTVPAGFVSISGDEESPVPSGSPLGSRDRSLPRSKPPPIMSVPPLGGIVRSHQDPSRTDLLVAKDPPLPGSRCAPYLWDKSPTPSILSSRHHAPSSPRSDDTPAGSDPCAFPLVASRESVRPERRRRGFAGGLLQRRKPDESVRFQRALAVAGGTEHYTDVIRVEEKVEGRAGRGAAQEKWGSHVDDSDLQVCRIEALTRSFETGLPYLGVKRSAVRIRPARRARGLATGTFLSSDQSHKPYLPC
jgi:hypothetical protein